MIRRTRQRSAVEQVFLEAERPLAPHEVLEAAQGKVPGLGIATVYRALKSLTEDGWLTPVEIPGQSTCYERAGKEHHHHFHCRECQKVFEVEGCPGDIRNLTPPGFRVETHEIILYGLCGACSPR